VPGSAGHFVLSSNTGLSVGAGQGKVNVSSADANGYVVMATSNSEHVDDHETANGITRGCTGSGGGCSNSTW
jgi:hypothetical protein